MLISSPALHLHRYGTRPIPTKTEFHLQPLSKDRVRRPSLLIVALRVGIGQTGQATRRASRLFVAVDLTKWAEQRQAAKTGS